MLLQKNLTGFIHGMLKHLNHEVFDLSDHNIKSRPSTY